MDAALQQDLTLRLREDLCQRRIEKGLAFLETHRRIFDSVGPEHADGAVLLGYVAQWVDAGFDTPGLIKNLLTQFPGPSRIHLPLIGYIHLRVAEGLVAMADEEFETAISLLEFVDSVEAEVPDNELRAIASFWIGRCLRSLGRYDEALICTVRAREIAQQLGLEKMAAVMRINESWLLFQKGRSAEAAAILDEADAALQGTDDYVARGNIQSAYGRIARRQGRYQRAVEHFTAGIAVFERRDPQHRNLARSKVNIAYVKRLISLQLQRRIDDDLVRRKAANGKCTAARASLQDERAQLESLRKQAFADLAGPKQSI